MGMSTAFFVVMVVLFWGFACFLVIVFASIFSAWLSRKEGRSAERAARHDAAPGIPVTGQGETPAQAGRSEAQEPHLEGVETEVR
jgi:hypothetical protein